jgi:hypothetical protein
MDWVMHLEAQGCAIRSGVAGSGGQEMGSTKHVAYTNEMGLKRFRIFVPLLHSVSRAGSEWGTDR